MCVFITSFPSSSPLIFLKDFKKPQFVSVILRNKWGSLLYYLNHGYIMEAFCVHHSSVPAVTEMWAIKWEIKFKTLYRSHWPGVFTHPEILLSKPWVEGFKLRFPRSSENLLQFLIQLLISQEATWTYMGFSHCIMALSTVPIT